MIDERYEADEFKKVCTHQSKSRRSIQAINGLAEVAEGGLRRSGVLIGFIISKFHEQSPINPSPFG